MKPITFGTLLATILLVTGAAADAEWGAPGLKSLNDVKAMANFLPEVLMWT